MSRDGKIHIMFLLQTLGTGGSERLVLDIAKNIDRKRFEPYVTSLYDGVLAQEFKRQGIWCTSLNKNVGLDFGSMYKFSKCVREKKIVVINAHHFSPFIHALAGAVLNRCALIYTEHTINEILQVPKYWVIIARLILRASFGVIGISKGCQEQLIKTFCVPEYKAFVVPNAVDLRRFETQTSREEVRRELGIEYNQRIIGMVGNLREQKNYPNLLKAFSIVLMNGHIARLVIIGDGPLLKDLKLLASQLGIDSKVMFLGTRSDTERLYNAMDVYCLASHYEGLPLSILEAMASKLPVVATNVTGINDVVVSLKNGLLVAPDNPAALAEGIMQILLNEELASALGRSGYEYVSAYHRIEPWIRSYEEIFARAARQ